MKWFKKCLSISHRNKSEPHHVGSQPDQSVVPASVPIAIATPPDTANTQDTSLPEDLWKSAYDKLNPEEQVILSTVQASAESEKEERLSQAGHIVDGVIQITEKQYKEYQQGGIKIHRSTGEVIDIRRVSRKILDAALSFKDIITAVVAFDPTHHAASAWTAVSLGLTMMQNRLDLRDALFESSEFLAEMITRSAYVEQRFYRNNSKKTSEICHAIIGVYRAILQYAVELLAAQNPSIGRRLLSSITPIDSQHITQLRSSIEKEWQKLCQWVHFDALDTLLQNGKEAESRLARIDEEVSEHLQSLIKRFSLPIAEGASYDSYENQHGEKCLPGTRHDLLHKIIGWAETPDKCIFWLNGMAGTGKSTISRTVAELLQDKGLLGASFFFKKGEADRGNARRFISTIARQLMASHPHLASGMLRAIRNDADLSTKALDQQFNKLLLQPLSEGEQYETTSVIVIDALDECEEDDIEVLLRLLPQLQKSKSIRLRIFLTSRPELAIRDGFKQSRDHQNIVLQDVPSIEHDIRVFLQHRFTQMKEKGKVSENWPGYERTEILVKMAVPLFIFAATVCRFIEEDYQVPEDQLDIILQNPHLTSSSQMEGIYRPILEHRLKNSSVSQKEFHAIVGVLILLANPLSVTGLSGLIGMQERTIIARLGAFHSVLSVPTDPGEPVRILHLSFREFLVNTTEGFQVNEKVTHGETLSHCLRVMRYGLKHNVCALSSYGTRREDIASQVIDQHIPQALQYSCRYWMYHWKHVGTQEWENDILSFLKVHFLHWLEAISLMGLASEIIGIINGLQELKDTMSTELAGFLQDASRFILKHIQMIHNTPLQVYCSGLAFSPTDSVIRKIFHNQRPNWMPALPQVQKSWSAELQTLEGHFNWVRSVALSPDGQRIVSGSNDNTIKLWDAQTGAELRTLKGHSNSVRSVAFSPDGQRIVSGSNDNTIKLWDAQTGAELRILEGHSNWVRSVAFSPDGQRIVSGSNDNTIKLWDAQTGAELRTLEGHSNWVRSVAFSPDGQRIVSGSGDHTIKLWDAQTGSELRTLEDHSDWVDSVASGNTHMEHNQGSQISVDNSWVYWRGKSVIWLPPEFRGPTCHAIKHDTFALGYPTGRVLIIRFRAPSD